jgi:hypothetical protein
MEKYKCEGNIRMDLSERGVDMGNGLNEPKIEIIGELLLCNTEPLGYIKHTVS